MTLAHYSLGATDAEHQRLLSLASHEEDRVIDACRRAGIGEGAHAVDFGCGPLGALAALSRVVGPAGSVTGVDASPAALARARLLSPSVQLVQADVNDVSLPPCDLAYSRLMLLHQQDPLRTLRNMHRSLNPGGVLIAHEPSDQPMHAPASQPPVPAMTRIWELVIAAARARGATTDFGLRGRALPHRRRVHRGEQPRVRRALPTRGRLRHPACGAAVATTDALRTLARDRGGDGGARYGDGGGERAGGRAVGVESVDGGVGGTAVKLLIS